MTGLELIPIGTLLSLLIDQVISTAIAINDVVIEKECFKTLSNYLSDIETIFMDLQKHELKDTPILRNTLGYLKEDFEKAKCLGEKYKDCGRFYSFLFCRRIADEIQNVTKDIGRSLSMLPLANTEVLSGISDKVDMLQAEMQEAVIFSQSSSSILGIGEQNNDQNSAKSMLELITSFAGIFEKPSEMIKELYSLRMEKEGAATLDRKEDEILLNEVIEQFPNAYVVFITKKYDQIRRTIDTSVIRNGRIPEYSTYRCPITKSVMVDPVDLCSGTTCERAAIEARFLEGNTEDPDPRKPSPLENLTLKPNISVRQLIHHWREQNYFLKIRQAKEVLQSGKSSAYDGSFCEIQKVIRENMNTKFWIGMEGLVEIIVLLLGSLDGVLKSRAFQTLLDIVERHSYNKDKAVVAGVLHHIVQCLPLDSSICLAAFNLLFEILQENYWWCEAIPQEDCRWNVDFCKKLKQMQGAIAFLVVIVLDKQFSEVAKKAEDILFQLCCNDDDIILAVASYHWYKPLVQRLCDGPDLSKKSMMRGLEKMHLVDEDVKRLGKDGVISPLVKLATGDAESKELAFSMMAKLSTSQDNINFFVEARAFSLILEQIFSPQIPSIIREKCFEIFMKLTSSGMEVLTGFDIVDQELMITNFLDMLLNSSSPISIRKPVFRVFLSICNSAKASAEKVVATRNCISIILPLLDDSDKEIQKLALQFLHQFSHIEPGSITYFLLDGNRLDTFMSFLKDDNQQELQILVVGLLAKLQNSNKQLIERLADLSAIPVLLNILTKGTMEAKENVLNLLTGFMNPADINMQKKVVDHGAYLLLVGILTSGSKAAKARAAALIGNLSSNSPILTAKAPEPSCFCFCSKSVPTCGIHGGICSVKSSFCLLESDALPPLVTLLYERDDAINLAVLLTLKTLVEKECGSRAAKFMLQFKAIEPMLLLLGRMNQALIGEVFDILLVVFEDKSVTKEYSIEASNAIAQFFTNRTVNTDDHLSTKATALCTLIDASSKGTWPG